MDEKERRIEPFNIERTRKNMKEDFDKITTLDDLKDFFLQLLPKMMDTDIYALESLRNNIELLKGRIGSIEAELFIQRDFAMKLSNTVKELDKTIALVFHALKDDED